MASAKGWRHLGLAPPARQALAADLFSSEPGEL
jgi:Holliday junction DNA helicase RuvB